MESAADDRLELSPEQMRALGYRIVDALVEHARTLDDQPALRKAPRAEMEALLREPPPERPSDPLALVERLLSDVFPHIGHLDHPRFFAFIPSPGNFVSVMADALAAGTNVFCGAWLESAGPAQVELVTLDWLRALCGLPEGAGGLFLSGGSMANLTALAVARHVALDDRLDGAAVYCSDQTHSSVLRALRVLGLPPGQVRLLRSDENFRLPLPPLRAAIAEDRAQGRRPWCVIANAGTTNTGSVDPLPALADLCDAEGLWLHVDGAHGAAAVLCEPGRAVLAGLECARTLVIDPHKWLFQPYEIGCLLVREERWLAETFRILPEYLQDVAGAASEVNFMDRGIQLTRGFRALKLWLSLKTFGLEAFRGAVARGIALAEHAEAVLRADAAWEVVSPARLGIVCFRRVRPGASPETLDALNRAAAEAVNASGFAFVATTVLRGRTVLRLCTINPRTREEDVRETLARLAAAVP